MKRKARILIIDDDIAIRKYLALILTESGYDIILSESLHGGMERCEREEIDIVLLDITLPDGNGLDALPRIQNSAGRPEVIIITGQSDADGAELAIQNGAWDYIEKPLSLEAILLPISRAALYHFEKRSIANIGSFNRQEIIGGSPLLCKSILHASRSASSGSNTLITGETGTGKELFARAIHQNSPRWKNNFVVVDCAALPENLVESILFGHVKGAFTGADKSNEGLIKLAHHGTLFLDEVGELSLATQKSFLRVLQEKKFRPVGGSNERESDFCIISATNRDLESLVHQGEFRQDLLFRLQSIQIELPPLRKREGDIKVLASHFINSFCRTNGSPEKALADELLAALVTYDWPGNIRELHNVLSYVLSVAGNSPTLYPDHLPVAIRAKIVKNTIKAKEIENNQVEHIPEPQGSALESYKEYRMNVFHQVEKPYLVNLMNATNWDMTQACTISGLSRSRLYALLKRHDISRTLN